MSVRRYLEERRNRVVYNPRGSLSETVTGNPGADGTLVGGERADLTGVFPGAQLDVPVLRDPVVPDGAVRTGAGGEDVVYLPDVRDDASQAIADAAAAASAADSKVRAFHVQPVPPYAVGDMWFESVTDDGGLVHRCVVARADGAYNAADWALWAVKAQYVVAEVAMEAPVITGGVIHAGKFATDADSSSMSGILIGYQVGPSMFESSPNTLVFGAHYNNSGPPLNILTPDAHMVMTLDGSGNFTMAGDGDIIATMAAGKEFRVVGQGRVTGKLYVDTPPTLHDIGAAGEVAFQNSWVNYGGTYRNAGYCKGPDNSVKLYGVIKLGANGARAFTLPAGYRPAADVIFAVMCNDVLGKVIVTSAGYVIPSVLSGTNAWISLSGIVFPAEA